MYGIIRSGAGLMLVAGSFLLVGCDSHVPATGALPETAPSKAVAATEPAEPVIAAKAPVPAGFAQALEAGMAAVEPKVTEKKAGFGEISLLPDHRYLLHPGNDKDGVIVIDVSGFQKLTISPMIESFAGNSNCMGSPKAGVVSLSWQLDAGTAQKVAMDRYYAGKIQVDTQNAKTLTLVSNTENDVSWCDWLGVGFVDVVAR